MTHQINRREFGFGALIATTSALMAGGTTRVQAQEWPAKPARIIEMYPPGVARDIGTRIYAQKLSAYFGRQVFVENRPGGTGRIAAMAAKDAAPDGYTFIMMGTADAITRHLYQLPYDVERDFEPVSLIGTIQFALVVRSSLPVKTLAEFIAFAKAHPGKLTYGSPGPGSVQHLNGAMLAGLTGTDLRHVPYGQGSPHTDLLGGHIDLIIDALVPTQENIRAGTLRALAITGEARTPIVPEVPTFAEAGLPAFDTYAFWGLLAPKGTPAPIIARMQRAIVEMLKDPDVQIKQGPPVGAVLIGSSPEEFATRFRSESKRWGSIIRENHISIE